MTSVPGDNPSYDFKCNRTLDDIRSALNAAGPWTWKRRDSDIYGLYLMCEPAQKVRISLYQRAQFRISTRPADEFNAWLELSAADSAARGEIDTAFRALLQTIGATDIVTI